MPITATPRLLSSFSLHPSDAPLRSRTAAPRKRFRMTRERFFCRRHYSQGRGHNKRGGYLPRKRLSLDFPAQSTYTPPPSPPPPLSAHRSVPPSDEGGETESEHLYGWTRAHNQKPRVYSQRRISDYPASLSLSLSLLVRIYSSSSSSSLLSFSLHHHHPVPRPPPRPTYPPTGGPTLLIYIAASLDLPRPCLYFCARSSEADYGKAPATVMSAN
jgi:hypothetical protein